AQRLVPRGSPAGARRAQWHRRAPLRRGHALGGGRGRRLGDARFGTARRGRAWTTAHGPQGRRAPLRLRRGARLQGEAPTERMAPDLSLVSAGAERARLILRLAQGLRARRFFALRHPDAPPRPRGGGARAGGAPRALDDSPRARAGRSVVSG